MKHMDIDTLLDILDWFDDSLYDYIQHILLTKLDGEARVRRAMPSLRRHARALVAAHRGHGQRLPRDAFESARLTMASGTGRNALKSGASREPHSFQIRKKEDTQ